MKHYILLGDDKFNFDIEKIYRPQNYKIILIGNEDAYRYLDPTKSYIFEKMYAEKKLTPESLSPLIQDIIQKAGEQSVFIITPHEECLMVAANLRNRLSIPGDSVNAIERFRNKLIMKKILEKSSIPTPKYLSFESIKFQNNPNGYIKTVSSYLGYPIFVKPIDRVGSIGAEKLLTHEDLLQWCLQHQHDEGCYELDEFIDASIYHCDSIIQNGRVIFSAVSEYVNTCFDFRKGQAAGSIILHDNHEDSILIKQFNTLVLEALVPPANCVTHLEVFKMLDGKVVFLEIAARAPGGLLPQCYEMRFGFNLEEVLLRLQMGIECDLSPKIGPLVAYLVIPPQAGVIKAINPFTIKSEHEVKWHHKVGDQLRILSIIVDTVAQIKIWGDDYTQLRQDLNLLSQHKFYVIEEGS